MTWPTAEIYDCKISLLGEILRRVSAWEEHPIEHLKAYWKGREVGFDGVSKIWILN